VLPVEEFKEKTSFEFGIRNAVGTTARIVADFGSEFRIPHSLKGAIHGT